VILKFYCKVYFSDTEACQGLYLFPPCDDDDVIIYTLFRIKCSRTLHKTEWLLLQCCNLSNIGGRVYVRVRFVLGLFSELLDMFRTRSPMFDRLQHRNNSHGLHKKHR